MVTRVSDARITPSLHTTPMVVVPFRTSWLAALFCVMFCCLPKIDPVRFVSIGRSNSLSFCQCLLILRLGNPDSSGGCGVACGLLCSETRPPPFYKARMFLGACFFVACFFFLLFL